MFEKISLFKFSIENESREIKSVKLYLFKSKFKVIFNLNHQILMAFAFDVLEVVGHLLCIWLQFRISGTCNDCNDSMHLFVLSF